MALQKKVGDTMRYEHIQPGVFVARPNRFIAHVEIGGQLVVAHVKNTGRCKELLVPGATVYVDYVSSPHRKTQYDLVAVEKGNLLINMDSYAPNIAFGEYLCQGRFAPLGQLTHVKAEARYHQSRFDFYVETATERAFIEVKGVTLEADGVAMFPDAPTLRGVKHLNHLAQCLEEGYQAYAVFIVQMQGMRYFTPNNKMHAAFGATLKEVAAKGVQVLALACTVTPESMVVDGELPVVLP